MAGIHFDQVVSRAHRLSARPQHRRPALQSRARESPDIAQESAGFFFGYINYIIQVSQVFTRS